MRHCLLPFVLASFVAGCASVRIESASGQVRVERRWGVLGVVVDGPAASHVAEVTSLGVVSTPMGWNAGFTRQSWAVLGPECRLVIWVSDAEHLETARHLEASTTGVCVAGPAPR